MSDLGDESGFTLVELLVAASIMVVLLCATFAVLDALFKNDRRNQNQSDSQAAVQAATDRVARELRNAASPGSTAGIERAADTDLVFQLVDPNGAIGGSNTNNVSRVRYCLDTSNPSNQKLWRQMQTWSGATAPALASPQTCPDFSWTNKWTQPPQVVLDHVTNTSGQPLFSYDSATPSTVGQVITDFIVNNGTTSTTRAAELRTSVTIRSSNKPPTASFTATPLGNGKVLFNGGGSSDPDNQTLGYYWYDGATQISPASTCTSAGCTTALFQYTAPATGTRNFMLKVVDPGGLSATSTQAVDVK